MKINLLSLTYGCKNNVAISDKYDGNRVFLFSFKKHALVDRVFTLLVVYRKQSTRTQEFLQMLQYLLVTSSIDIIARSLIMIF